MIINFACRAAPDSAANDDYVLAAERFAVVLDGATAPVGIESGCIHNVPWLTCHLAGNVAQLLATETDLSLTDVLRLGIQATMTQHQDTCDLTNRDSPSSTIAIVRERGEQLDYLVLGDSPVIIERHDGELVVAEDNRIEHLGSYTREAVSLARNTAGGFWAASTNPEAADNAITGSLPLGQVSRVLMVTDGVTRLIERYGYTWRDLIELADKSGPDQVVAEIRAREHATPPGTYQGKHFDDATVLLAVLPVHE